MFPNLPFVVEIMLTMASYIATSVYIFQQVLSDSKRSMGQVRLCDPAPVNAERILKMATLKV